LLLLFCAGSWLVALVVVVTPACGTWHGVGYFHYIGF
jgi:hypothetical protein